MSAREKFNLQKVDSLIKSLNKPLRKALADWNYFDSQYQILSEPVIQTIFNNDELLGFTTKNSYGVLCLNSPQIMFVDIDLDKTDGCISSKAFPWSRLDVNESEVITAIAQTAKDCGLMFSAYRTAAGMRLIEMSRLWQPDGKDTAEVFQAVGCDPLYQTLCKTQNTFRARLEIKPWRDGDAVCSWMGFIGDASVNAIALRIKDFHDSFCLGDGDLA